MSEKDMSEKFENENVCEAICAAYNQTQVFTVEEPKKVNIGEEFSYLVKINDLYVQDYGFSANTGLILTNERANALQFTYTLSRDSLLTSKDLVERKIIRFFHRVQKSGINPKDVKIVRLITKTTYEEFEMDVVGDSSGIAKVVKKWQGVGNWKY